MPLAAPSAARFVVPVNHRSSKAAIDLIVTEEDSSEAYYNRHYTHFEWPARASGPTVGIGYDCGYVSLDELRRDWSGIVPEETIGSLLKACGMRGEAANSFVQAHGGSVTITWYQAITQFTTRELPKWEARVSAALPNSDMLSADCFGALTSLSYNRGTGGFLDPGPRYTEMRTIRGHMIAMRFNLIPDEILSMRRLWPKGGGLWNRRVREADLFERGLAVTP